MFEVLGFFFTAGTSIWSNLSLHLLIFFMMEKNHVKSTGTYWVHVVSVYHYTDFSHFNKYWYIPGIRTKNPKNAALLNLM